MSLWLVCAGFWVSGGGQNCLFSMGAIHVHLCWIIDPISLIPTDVG